MVGYTIQSETKTETGKEIQIRAIGQLADICFFTGKMRQGKSYLAKHLLTGVTRSIVWDYNFEHTQKMGIIVHTIRELVFRWNHGIKRIIYQPYDRSEEHFDRFIKTVSRMQNLVLLIEEVRRYATAKKISKPLQFLIDTGRHRGIGIWFTSRRMHGIAVDIPFNATHIFAFKQHRPEDLSYLSQFMNPELVEKLPTLPNYYFLHYISDTGETLIHAPI